MFKTKMKQYLTWQRLLALTGLGVLIAMSLSHSLSAQAVTEGYNADSVLQRGMIVAIKKDDNTKVEPVSGDKADQMHGVIVNANDAPVTLSNDGQRVFVATTGHYDVLVSTQMGTVASGDFITVSAIAGIGMKAGTADQYIIGRAIGNFDGSKDVVSTTQLKDSDGATKQVSIGRVSVDIGVAKNPLLKASEPNVPQFLQKAAAAIAGKPVNAVRIYLGILIFLITTIIAASLLYGGVRSALISIGRNPLSKKTIIRGMIQVIITGMIVFLIGVFGVYLILRL
ncbi:MAG TPA: hypothetical protein VLF87_01765 [Patescibacteria group bacterium]|nr:hypothetical protein [Patescibacteria group bacterium]